MKYLLVKVDTNDADYVERLTSISDENLKLMLPLFEAIKNFKPYTVTVDEDKKYPMKWTHHHNFPYGEAHRGDLGEKTPEELYPEHREALEIFQDNHIPFGEYGFHDIESVKILTVTEIEEIL